MEVSFLTHAFGLRDVDYVRTTYPSGMIQIHVRTKLKSLKCSNCKSKDVTRKGIKVRIFRTVPIGMKPVQIIAEVQRLACKECGMTRQEHLDWVDKKKLIRED